MNYTIKMSDTAKQDLRDIAMWLFRKTNDIELSKKFVNELRDSCKTLNLFPKAGAFPKDRVMSSQGYRYISYKEYLIFYLIDDEKLTVIIMAIIRENRDYMRVFAH